MKRIKSDLRIVINLIDWTHIVERFWRVTSKQSKGLKVLSILSAIGTATYNLAKFFVLILKQLVRILLILNIV